MFTTNLGCECGQIFTVHRAVIGGTFRCPKCDEAVIVPGVPVDYISDDDRAQISARIARQELMDRRTNRLVNVLSAAVALSCFVACCGAIYWLVISFQMPVIVTMSWRPFLFFVGGLILLVVLAVIKALFRVIVS